MSRMSLLPIAVVSVALLAGCASSYEGSTPAEFASTACTTWLDTGAIDGLSGSENTEGLTGSGEEQRSQAIEIADGVIADWENSRDTIVAAKPAVQDGDEIVGLFAEYYDTRIEASADLIEEFRSFPTDTGEFDELVRQGAEALFLGMEDTEADAPYPFPSIEDQQVVDAVLADETCSTFVTERDW